MHSGGRHAPGPAPGRAAVTIGMPTFNRPTDGVATLRAIGEDQLVRSVVTAVVIPDQGYEALENLENTDRPVWKQVFNG